MAFLQQKDVLDVVPLKEWLTVDEVRALLKKKYDYEWSYEYILKMLTKMAKNSWYFVRKLHREDKFMVFDNYNDYHNFFGKYIKSGVTVKIYKEKKDDGCKNTAS